MLLENSISTWAQLAKLLILEFNEVGDPYSLLSQFIVIQHDPMKNIYHFNLRFTKYWARLSLNMSPHTSMALIFYLRVFTLDLAARIQMNGPQ